MLMVTYASATQSAPNEQFQDQIPIDADHSGMVKFGHAGQEDYNTVRGRLLNLVKEAPGVIGKRFGDANARKSMS